MYSEMTAKVDLWNLMKFWDLRDDDHAQFEIRKFAEATKLLASDIVPFCVSLYDRRKAGERK